MKYRMRILQRNTREDIIHEMKRLGADPSGIGLMFPKGLTRIIRLSDVPCTVANLLKQELLSRGGDCAVSHGTLTHSVETTDLLMVATERQYRKLIRKLKRQDFFGLPAFADDLEQCIRSYNLDRFPCTIGSEVLDLGARTYIMGILNVTPDSFSDGGNYQDVDAAVDHALRLVEAGADFIDVGGESTRPGAEQVVEEEERRRILPVVERLVREPGLRISVDTYKAGVARSALDAGAHMINDISAFRFDPKMAPLISERGVPVVLMHIQGTPKEMQQDPSYEDVVGEVLGGLEESLEIGRAAGVRDEQMWIDPGIGFGKRLQDNLDLLKHLTEFKVLGRPILLGTSRKSMIGAILDLPVEKRVEGSLAAAVMGIMGGANVVRAHDVRETVRAARMADAVMRRN